MTSDYGLPFLLGPAPDMLRAMKNEEVHRPRIAIVGAGKLGAALAISLRGAGYSISEVVSRDREGSRRKAKALARRVGTGTATFQTSALRAELVWFCVPDGEIERCARLLAARDWEGKIAVHSSGAMTSDELRVLRNRGARVASVHPMMTFVEEVTPALKGVGFAIEGDREAVQTISKIVRRLGGQGSLPCLGNLSVAAPDGASRGRGTGGSGRGRARESVQTLDASDCSADSRKLRETRQSPRIQRPDHPGRCGYDPEAPRSFAEASAGAGSVRRVGAIGAANPAHPTRQRIESAIGAVMTLAASVTQKCLVES